MTTEDPPPKYTPTHSPSSQTVNVLVVGETQQGKSTLIRHISRYAGAENTNVPVGFGNVRCTTNVDKHIISVVLRQYRLVDKDGRDIKELSYADYCDLTGDEATVVPVSSDSEPRINLMMIDTPGLDDSQGEDFDIMASIVGTVGNLDHINAVVYVRNMGRPFSASFKQFFGYIQRCMPALSNGMVIVNTSFTVDKNERYISKKQDLAEIRREAFNAATGLDLQHFFMDNEPVADQPFGVFQSMNETYRLLTFLSSQRPLLTTHLKLLKTPKMANFDAHIVNALLEVRNSLDREWNVEKARAGALQQSAMVNQRRIEKTTRRLDKKKALVRELSNGADIVLGSKRWVSDYSFIAHLLFKGQLNLGSQRCEFDADSEITVVTKTCSSGSKWLDEHLRGTSWRAVLTSGIFRDINGTATFYTTSKAKHRNEIRALEAAISELEDTLEDLQQNVVGSGVEDAKVKLLGESVESVEQLIETLKMDTFAVEIWPEVRSLYLGVSRPSKSEVKAFAAAFDANVASLL